MVARAFSISFFAVAIASFTSGLFMAAFAVSMLVLILAEIFMFAIAVLAASIPMRTLSDITLGSTAFCPSFIPALISALISALIFFQSMFFMAVSTFLLISFQSTFFIALATSALICFQSMFSMALLAASMP